MCRKSICKRIVFPFQKYFRTIISSERHLKGFSKKELRYARNEIYARHGRIFNDDELQAYFEGKSWYVGTQIAEEFDESELSKVEKANVRLIQKYENK